MCPKGKKKPWPKPSAGARSKPMYEKAECCPNTGVFFNPSLSSKLFFLETYIRKNGKKSQWSRNWGKYNSSDWLLEKMVISLGFWFYKSCLKCWNPRFSTTKQWVFFLLLFFIKTFHLKIDSANMTFTNQSKIFLFLCSILGIGGIVCNFYFFFLKHATSFISGCW